MQLLISNPPKKGRKGTRRRSARPRPATPKGPPMAKRRRRRSSSSKSSVRFSSTPRRKSSRRGFASLSGAFTIGGAVRHGVAAGVGAIGTVGLLGMIGPSLPAALSSTPTARAATKAAVGVALGWAAAKAGQGKYAAAIAAGGIATAIVDVYNAWRSQSQAARVQGLDYFNVNGGIGQLPDYSGTIYDAAGNPVEMFAQ